MCCNKKSQVAHLSRQSETSLVVKADGFALELANGSAVGASSATAPAAPASATTVTATPTAAPEATTPAATATTTSAAKSSTASTSAAKATAVLRLLAGKVEPDHARAAALAYVLAIGLLQHTLGILNAVERDVSEAPEPTRVPICPLSE
jgi:hypothetical protein